MAGIPSLSIPFVEGGLPSQKIWKTSDEYTSPTDMFFTIKSQRIELQGHPFFKSDSVPLVSPQQYRVFSLALPDPNSFNISAQHASLSDTKYVWQLRGFKINREGPLRAATDGNINFNPENPANVTTGTAGPKDVLAFDLPAMQEIVVGCKPALGITYSPIGGDSGKTLILGLEVSEIADGDLAPMGFGALDIGKVNTFLDTKYFLPSIQGFNPLLPTKQISEIEMDAEETGDRDFFRLRREQTFAKTLLQGRGAPFEFPDPNKTFNSVFSIPSGSVVSGLNDIFNKRYWLSRGEHQNNCLAWDDKFYFTVLDNTRGQNIVLPVGKEEVKAELTKDSLRLVTRHVETFQFEVVVRLVKVKLEAELIQYLYRMNKDLINKWGYGWNRGSMPLKEQNKFLIGPHSTENEETIEEKEIFNCINIDYNGTIHKDLQVTDCGRHYRQFLASETFTGKPQAPARATRAPRGGKRKA